MIMKKMVWSLALVACVACIASTSFAAGAGWMTDYKKAKSKAKAQNKLLVMDFTGSDWCPPCMKMEKEVFNSSSFKSYASKNVVLLYLDFPNKKKQSSQLKKQNAQLAKKYGVQSFPTVIVLDPSGKQLSKTPGYDGRGPKSLIAKLQKLQPAKSKSSSNSSSTTTTSSNRY